MISYMEALPYIILYKGIGRNLQKSFHDSIHNTVKYNIKEETSSEKEKEKMQATLMFVQCKVYTIVHIMM